MTEEGLLSFSVAGFQVTAYGLCVVLALAVGMFLLAWQCRRDGLKPETASIAGLLALPLGLIGARVFYCAVRINFYLEIGLVNMLRLWDGGYALWGALGGAALAAIITGKVTRQPAARVLDAFATPAALVIALCRFAEYLNGEGIGMSVENETFCRFPFVVFNPYYEEWYWAVFVLEGAAALAIFAVLMRTHRKPGDKTRLFLILYSACQVLLESMRRDNYLRWLFVRASQLTAVIVLALLMIAALIRWIRTEKNSRRLSSRRMLGSWLIFAACVGICVWMEFAIDKSPDLPVWAAYCIMAVCCMGMGTAAWNVVLGKKT